MAFLAAGVRWRAGPAVLAVFLAAVSTVMLALRPAGTFTYVSVPLAVIAAAPLAVARRFPSASLGLVLGANACYLLFPRLGWPAAAGAAGLLALGACPNLLPRWRALAAGVAGELVVLCAALLPQRVNGRPWDATVAEALAVVTAWGAGEMYRAWLQGSAERSAAAAEVRALSERSSLARERASIARELHDVVAHHVSLIAVRAATAHYAISGLPAEGHAAFHEIAAQSRTALSELRVILGVLRGPDGQPEAAPQPRIADLGGMLTRIREAGTDVTITVRGDQRDLPDSVELCVYRIVQEAMTNTRCHAPGASAAVDLCYLAGEVRVRVHDSGTAQAGRSGPYRNGDAAGPAARPGQAGARQPDGTAAPGFGLTGMRERVMALGGSFEAGPDGSGGFRVAACLPVSGDVPPAFLHGLPSGSGDGPAGGGAAW